MEMNVPEVHLEKGKLSILPCGVVVGSGFLSELKQKKLVELCMALTLTGENATLLPKEKFNNPNKKARPLLFYNWKGHPESMLLEPPTELLELANKVWGKLKKAYKKKAKKMKRTGEIDERPQFQFPSTFRPNAMYGIMYPYEGKFGAHIDGAQGWVMAVSVGDSAKFYFSETFHSQRTYVQVDSGDVVLFNGGILYHGVECIPHSAPAFWNSPKCSMSVYQMARFNLQFRDADSDTLSYRPIFMEEDCEQHSSYVQKLSKYVEIRKDQ